MMDGELTGSIKQAARPATFPDGTSYTSLSVTDTSRIGRTLGETSRAIEIAALEAGIVPERYARNLKTLSTHNQVTLLESTVAIVGLGGLGGGVVEMLARIGIGTLILIDGDQFEDSNLNRQFLSSHQGLATSKAEAARDRVHRINASVSTECRSEFFTARNAAELLKGTQIVVDCLDNLPARFDLEEAAKAEGIPMVSAAVAGNAGHITTIFPEDIGLRLIYGEPGSMAPKGAETALGTLVPAVTLLASLECSEVVKILLNQGKLLRNRLLAIDLADHTYEVMDLR